jgi:hypothetical protein
MVETMKKVKIEAPFKQREYIKLLKETARSLQGSAIREKLLQMCDVLINDDYRRMSKEIPEKFYEIIGGSSGLIVGKCIDPDDVFTEEPQASVREISKEEFENDE